MNIEGPMPSLALWGVIGNDFAHNSKIFFFSHRADFRPICPAIGFMAWAGGADESSTGIPGSMGELPDFFIFQGHHGHDIEGLAAHHFRDLEEAGYDPLKVRRLGFRGK